MGKIGTFFAALPTWVQGLLAAVEGGLIGFALQWVSDPDPICFSRVCLRHFGGAIVGAIVVSLRNWLKQSPLSRDAWTPEQRASIAAAKEATPPAAAAQPPPPAAKP